MQILCYKIRVYIYIWQCTCEEICVYSLEAITDRSDTKYYMQGLFLFDVGFDGKSCSTEQWGPTISSFEPLALGQITFYPAGSPVGREYSNVPAVAIAYVLKLWYCIIWAAWLVTVYISGMYNLIIYCACMHKAISTLYPRSHPQPYWKLFRSLPSHPNP